MNYPFDNIKILVAMIQYNIKCYLWNALVLGRCDASYYKNEKKKNSKIVLVALFNF
jgi:hypothetical protein